MIYIIVKIEMRKQVKFIDEFRTNVITEKIMNDNFKEKVSHTFIIFKNYTED